MIVGRIHDSVEYKEGQIKDLLSRSETLALAVSCTDGILLVACKINPKSLKIKQVFDRIAFVGAGNVADYEKICQAALATAHKLGHITYSPGDVRIYKEVRRLIAEGVEAEFKNLFSSQYFVCEEILAQVDFEQEKDEVDRINFTGEIISVGPSWLIIPHVCQFPAAALESLNESISMREAFQKISKGAREASGLDSDSRKFIFEVATLSRWKVREKKFDEVYHKFSAAEVQSWLN